jgi:hypothetical protein
MMTTVENMHTTEKTHTHTNKRTIKGTKKASSKHLPNVAQTLFSAAVTLPLRRREGDNNDNSNGRKTQHIKGTDEKKDTPDALVDYLPNVAHTLFSAAVTLPVR